MAITSPFLRAAEVLAEFLRLGCTAFGGPVAHLGYFRERFVVRLGWISEARFANLVALAQALPGPSSSQVALAIGHAQAGLPGAGAAFLGFTLPGATLLVALALSSDGGRMEGLEGAVVGMHVAAAAVVASALLGMARRLARGLRRAVVAVLAGLVAFAVGGIAGQLLPLLLGLVAGLLFLPGRRLGSAPRPARSLVRRGLRIAGLLLLLFLLLPAVIPLVGLGRESEVIYGAGSLVFGGGHVVLPLLVEGFVGGGGISEDRFLAGYGLVQACPGPLFGFAAWLGALAPPPLGGLGGALVALGLIFLPGFLLLGAAGAAWPALERRPGLGSALDGIQAAVVGLLGAALLDPVLATAVGGPATELGGPAGAVAAGGVGLAFFALVVLRAPAPLVVLAAAGCGLLLHP